MLTRKTFFAAITAGIIGAGTTGLALAQPGPGGPGGWHHDGGLLEGISLTDDQKTKLHALMKSGHADEKALHEQLRTIHENIDAALLSSGSVTATTLAPLVQQQEGVMQQLDAMHISNEIAVRNLLTADQIAKASSTHAQLAVLHQQEQALHSASASSEQPE